MNDKLFQSALRWRCRRGMRELDVLLAGWLDRHWETAGDAERARFERLLGVEDDLLWSWLSGRDQPREEEMRRLVESIRELAGS